MNVKYLIVILSIIFFGCTEPEALVCHGNQEMDECGVCGGPGPKYICENGTYACNASACHDDYTSTGCMDPNALNYNSSATQELICDCIYPCTDEGPENFTEFCEILEGLDVSSCAIDCNDEIMMELGHFDEICTECLSEDNCDDLDEYDYDYGGDGKGLEWNECLNDCIPNCDYEYIIDLNDLVSGSITTFITTACIPIYFINTSNTDIAIITENTDIPKCFGNTIAGDSCEDVGYLTACENEEGCNWEIPAEYNPIWNNFNETIPAHTTSERYFCDCSGPALATYEIDDCDCDNDIILEECEELCSCENECSDCSLVNNQYASECEVLCIDEHEECEELCIYEHADGSPCALLGSFPCAYTVGCYIQGEFQGSLQIPGNYQFYDKDNPGTIGMIVIE